MRPVTRDYAGKVVTRTKAAIPLGDESGVVSIGGVNIVPWGRITWQAESTRVTIVSGQMVVCPHAIRRTSVIE